MTCTQEKRILVVDDDPDLLDLLEDFLEEYKLTRARSGSEGIQRIEGLHHDLVVTDVRMPCGSGYAFLEFLKVERPQVPVILMSGVDDIDIAQESLERGAFTFLFKPFDREELLEAVVGSLSKK